MPVNDGPRGPARVEHDARDRRAAAVVHLGHALALARPRDGVVDTRRGGALRERNGRGAVRRRGVDRSGVLVVERLNHVFLIGTVDEVRSSDEVRRRGDHQGREAEPGRRHRALLSVFCGLSLFRSLSEARRRGFYPSCALNSIS